MRISLSLKIILAYLVCAIGFLAVTLYGIGMIQQMSFGAQRLVDQDLQNVLLFRELRSSLLQLDRSHRLTETALGQSGSLLDARRPFERYLRQLQRQDAAKAEQLDRLYQAYLVTFVQSPSQAEVSGLKKVPYGRLLDRIDEYRSAAEYRLRQHQRRLVEQPIEGSMRLLLSCLVILVAGLLLFVVLSGWLVATIRRLRSSVTALAQGEYDTLLMVRRRDELGDLCLEINGMAQRLKSSRQLFLDASPLTYLPGNIAIERALTERLRNDQVFALCYLDLDDFKPFNDHYGYARGSEVIKATAKIIHEARAEVGNEQDFVGHIGGDDFVVLTSLDRVEKVCCSIIDRFDAMIPDFYAVEDRKKGTIQARDRFGQVRDFPIMTVSLAVVTNANRAINSPVEIARIAAEIKEYVKPMPGSNFLVDRRTKSR